MISWATTVDPATSFVGLTSISAIVPQEPGAGASVTITTSAATTHESNWSRSVTVQTSGTFSRTSSRVFGLIDSVLGSSTTVRNVIDITETVTTDEYTYRATTTDTTATTVYATTVVGSQTRTTASETQRTITTLTEVVTGERTAYTTTNAEETIRTPILATVYLAQDDEVIWYAPTSAATNLAGAQAASFAASTATRLTVLPWTQTAVAVAANTNDETVVELPAISAQITHGSVSIDYENEQNRQAVVNYNALPNETFVSYEFPEVIENSALPFTVAPPETFTARGAVGSETLCVLSTVTVRAFTGGSSFSDTTTVTTTISREHSVATAESSSASETNEVLAYNGTDPEDSYTWTASRYSTTSNLLTTFARRTQGIATSFAVGSKSYEAYSGVVDEDGSISLGYSLNSNLGGAGNLAASVSRDVLSIFPQSNLFPASSVSATFSSLSATLAFPGSTSTTTTTAEVAPFGAPIKVFSGPNQWRSAVDRASLGRSETVYLTLPRGVYSTEGATFSTTGRTTSFASGAGASSAAPLSVSFIVGQTTLANADKIVWSASRNSHASLSALVSEGAYSAP
jgi:hypothetical protein